MSFIAVNWVMQRQVGSPTAKYVLYQLADMANDEGVCFPSVKMIAARTELDERTVRRAIRFLIEKGLLAVSPSLGRKSNTYYLVMDGPRVSSEPTLSQSQGSSEPTLSQSQGSSEPTLSQSQGNPVTESGVSAPSPPSTPLSRVEPPNRNQGGCGGDLDPIGFVRASYRQHGFTRPSDGAVEAEARAVMALFHAGVTVGELTGLSRRIFSEGERVVRQRIRVFRYLRDHLPQERDKLRRLPPQGMPSYYRLMEPPPDWGGLTERRTAGERGRSRDAGILAGEDYGHCPLVNSAVAHAPALEDLVEVKRGKQSDIWRLR